MKTPQEIAAELWKMGCNCAAVDNGVGIMHEPYCEMPSPDDVATAIAAAREEGRREGIEQAAGVADGFANEAIHDYAYLYRNVAHGIRALASQPKPEPAVTCEGCKRGWPADRIGGSNTVHRDTISGAMLPCTAKPEGGKEPGT